MGGGNAIQERPKQRTRSVGRFLRTDENGWLTEKKRLDQISPSGAVIDSYINDSSKYVGQYACIKRRLAENQTDMPLAAYIKKKEEKTNSLLLYGADSHSNKNQEVVFRAQKAVQKLKHDNRPDLAAFTLAIDSNRELDRSKLVPMAPSYKKVTDYLKNNTANGNVHNQQTQRVRDIRSKRFSQGYSMASHALGGQKQYSVVTSPTGEGIKKVIQNRPQSSYVAVGLSGTQHGRNARTRPTSTVRANNPSIITPT